MDKRKITKEDSTKLAYICATFIEDVGRFTGHDRNEDLAVPIEVMINMIKTLNEVQAVIGSVNRAMSRALMDQVEYVGTEKDDTNG